MKWNIGKRRSESGSTLLIVLLVLLTLTVLGLATIYIASNHAETAIRSRSGTQAFFIAEAGVNEGMRMVSANTSLITTTYVTSGYGGANPDFYPQISGGQPCTGGPSCVFLGLGPVNTKEYAHAALKIGQSPSAMGQVIECGLVGFSERFGSARFKVESKGYGAVNASREIEAHGLLPPREGLCPPGKMVTGGYSGSY